MAKAKTFKYIFTKKFYLLEFVLGSFIYTLIYLAIMNTNKFIILSRVSEVLISLLILSSSILLVIATFIIKSASKPSGYAGGVYSVVASLLGSFFVSCGCQASLLITLLYFIGLNTVEASYLYTFLASYNTFILLAFIIINILLIYYYLGMASQYTKEGKKEILGKFFTK
ncbi:MAG: hypothetical protein RXP92_01875 [Candidatus Micrarchaeota archaeon]